MKCLITIVLCTCTRQMLHGLGRSLLTVQATYQDVDTRLAGYSTLGKVPRLSTTYEYGALSLGIICHLRKPGRMM